MTKTLLLVTAMFCVSGLLLLGSQPIRGDEKTLKSRRDKVLADLKRNQTSIANCELRVKRYFYSPDEDDTPTKVDSNSLFTKLNGERARKDLASLNEVLQQIVKPLPGAPDWKTRADMTYTQEGKKTHWEFTHPDGSYFLAVFDGVFWLCDNGQQVNLRAKGAISTDTLDKYRYLPSWLASGEQNNNDLKLKLEEDALIMQKEGIEYWFAPDGCCTAVQFKNRDRADSLIFQYYFDTKLTQFALPSVRVDVACGEGKFYGLTIYWVETAHINQKVPGDTFIVPVPKGRLFVDERRQPRLPVYTTKDWRDARTFANSPESDARNTPGK